ncbi:MAG TPA: DUF2802 domain-containing protein [Firmicutes bacterium]|nr:DUF2802 domain-containing protein [Bacillota bacterium]
MPYLVLVLGLVLVFLAAFMLGQKREEPGGERSNSEVMPPLAGRETETVLQLAEMVESALAELDEKKLVLQNILSRYEEHRAAIEQRLQLLDRLQDRQAQENGEAPGNESAAFRLHRQVYALSDQGASVAEISASLGMGRGEVQLILSLRSPRS